MPLCAKERGSGERKRRLAPRLSPYQTISTSPLISASSHAFANALQAASRSKNVKLPFRRKAGRQLHVIADLPSPPADRASACRPSRTRHRHLAGRRGCGGRRIRPPLPTSGIEKIHFDCENLRGKKNGGERGIRTLGEFPHTTFPMWRLRPLDHLSE